MTKAKEAKTRKFQMRVTDDWLNRVQSAAVGLGISATAFVISTVMRDLTKEDANDL